jgi:propanol-preferring alcohol dehydrogenase
MRAYAVSMFCEPVEEIEQADVAPQGTQVVLEVTRCGVCHSDLHLQDGYYDLGGGRRLTLADRGIKPPFVMGHEVLGRLVAKGPDAPLGDEAIGRTFLVYPWLGCGTCDNCLRGEENYCPSPSYVGVHRPGGYAEQCLVPHPRYLVDVEGIDPGLAATYACSGVTAYSALKKVEIDKENDLLLLIGVGGVGLNGLTIARGLGFRHIAVADIDPDKRALATRYGADLTVDPNDPDAIASLTARPGGVAASVDFVGAAATARFGSDVLRKGGLYVAVGLYGGDITIPLPSLVLRALGLRGSHVGSLGDLAELIALVKSGNVEPIPVETVPFDTVNEALGRLRAGKVQGRLVLARD